MLVTESTNLCVDLFYISIVLISNAFEARQN